MTTTSQDSQESLRLEATQPQSSVGSQMQSFEIELNLGGVSGVALPGVAGVGGNPHVSGVSHTALEVGIPGISFLDESAGKLGNLEGVDNLENLEGLKDLRDFKDLKDLRDLAEAQVQVQGQGQVQVQDQGHELGLETLLGGAEADSLSLPAALCDDLLLEEINSIPDKMGFKIGDVADLLGIKQYVLRYWESEFDILRPKKASNNQRMYSRKDVENAFLIRKLLHRDRFSIEGARNALKELKAHVRKEKDYTQVFVRLESFHERIEDLAREIRGLRRLFKT